MRVLYLILFLLNGFSPMTNHQYEYLHRTLPFFVMKPYTIINQTLHSYCKEQTHFNTEPMFLNLTQWPSGLIYARNPYELSDYEFDEECTMELRASQGDRIRIVFYSAEINDERDISTLEYSDDESLISSSSSCLKIRDNEEIRIYNCSRQSTTIDYISTSHMIYLEILSRSLLINDYDENLSYRFHLFFTSLTPVLHTGVCPSSTQFNCNDSHCVHRNARCNGIDECLSKLDERVCTKSIENRTSIVRPSLIIFLIFFRLFLFEIEVLDKSQS